jgi:hypothetical protein
MLNRATLKVVGLLALALGAGSCESGDPVPIYGVDMSCATTQECVERFGADSRCDPVSGACKYVPAPDAGAPDGSTP